MPEAIVLEPELVSAFQRVVMHLPEGIASPVLTKLPDGRMSATNAGPVLRRILEGSALVTPGEAIWLRNAVESGQVARAGEAIAFSLGRSMPAATQDALCLDHRRAVPRVGPTVATVASFIRGDNRSNVALTAAEIVAPAAAERFNSERVLDPFDFQPM